MTSENDLLRKVSIYKKSLSRLQQQFHTSSKGGFDFSRKYDLDSIESKYQETIFDKTHRISIQYGLLIKWGYQFGKKDVLTVLDLTEMIANSFHSNPEYGDAIEDCLVNIAQKTAQENYDNFPSRFAYLLTIEPSGYYE